METMVQRVAGRPYVNHIPTMIGGAGQGPLSAFYRDHFIFKNPEMKTEPISRTIGHNQLVDEVGLLAVVPTSKICRRHSALFNLVVAVLYQIIVTMVHNRPIDWMLPGVAPTGHTIEVPLVAIVRFDQEDGEWKLTHEHIYWDQASVLAQVSGKCGSCVKKKPHLPNPDTMWPRKRGLTHQSIA